MPYLNQSDAGKFDAGKYLLDAMISCPPPKALLEAEQAILGSLLIDSSIAPKLFAAIQPSDFLHKENQALFSVARAMFRDNRPIDVITLYAAYTGGDNPKIDKPGATLKSYLAQLMEITPTSANWKEYAQILKEQTTLFRAKLISYALRDAKTLDEFREISAAIADTLRGHETIKPFDVKDLFCDFFDRQELPPPEYLNYGIPALNKGLYTESGDVVVIGGLSSSGKTALSLQLAWEIAKEKKVCFFSLETSKSKIADRVMSSSAQIKLEDIKKRTIPDDGWLRFERMSMDIFGFRDDKGKITGYRKLNVITKKHMTLDDIENITLAYGYDVIFIDYVQALISGFRNFRGDLREKVVFLSMELHQFAQEHGVTIFELSQLARPSKYAAWSAPDMFDLKESGQLEQDADAVLLLYRPKENDPVLDFDKNRFLKVAKNKEGSTGTMILDFDAERQTFHVRQDSADIMRAMYADKKRTGNVARQYSDAGRAAKARNAQIAAEEDQMRLLERPIDDDSDLPF